jgi:hypothetical protein
MKRLAIITALLLAMAGVVRADEPMRLASTMVVGSGVSAAAACTSSSDSVKYSQINYTTGEYYYVDRNNWRANKVSITGNMTVTCYSGRWNDTATYNNNTEFVELFTDDGGSPSKPSASVSGTKISGLAESSIPDGVTDGTEIEVCLDTPKDINAGTYWIVFSATGTDTNTNKIPNRIVGGVSTYTVSTDQGTNWATPSSVDLFWKISGCDR